MGGPTPPPAPVMGQIGTVVQPGAWPTEEVREILEWAWKLGVQGVKEVIDVIQDCLGHPATAIEHASFWVGVETSLKNSQTKIQQDAIGMTGLWEGQAYQQFMRWEAGLEAALIGSGDAAVEMKDVTLSMVSYIIDTYNALLNFIVETHADLMERIGRLLGALAGLRVPTEILAAVGSEACNMLASFERNVKNLITDAVKVLEGYKKQAINVKSAVADAVPAPAYPDRAKEPARWNPTDIE